MNEQDFLNTLIMAIDKTDGNNEITNVLRKSKIYFEYTGIFTRIEWNTYCAILHIKTPLMDIDKIEKGKKKILEVAGKIFGRIDEYLLTDISVDILVEKYESIDFTELGKTITIKKAISDADMFMKEGNYTSAVDRVHTSLHGYIRYRLEQKKIPYEDSETITQLYTKLHTSIEAVENSAINEMIKKAIRSASGTVDSINTARNKHSLAHPNDEICDINEAKLIIGICKHIFDYVESRV